MNQFEIDMIARCIDEQRTMIHDSEDKGASREERAAAYGAIDSFAERLADQIAERDPSAHGGVTSLRLQFCC